MASSVLFRRSRAAASMRMRGIVSGNLPMCCTSSRSSRRWLGTTAGGGGGAPGPAGPGGREPLHSASSGEPSATAVPVDDGSLLFVAETAGLHLKGGARLAAQAVDPQHYGICVRNAYKDGQEVPREFDGSEPIRMDELLDCAADLHALQNHLVPGASVLDAGCGMGFMTAVLSTAVLGGPIGNAGTENAGQVAGIDRVTDKTDIAVRAVASAVPVGRLPSLPTGYSRGSGGGDTLSQESPNENENDEDKDTGGPLAGCVGVEPLRHITVMPSDATMGGNVGAPYHAIRVRFALPSLGGTHTTTLLNQLRRGGRMVAPVESTDETEEQQQVLWTFDKPLEGGEIEMHEVGQVRVRRGQVQTGGVELQGESTVEAREAKAQRKQNVDLVKQQLVQWRSDFVEREGRTATRDDLMNDPMAKELFQLFSALNNAA